MGISDHSGEKKNGQAETHPAESVMSRFSHIQDAHRVQRDCQTEVWVPRALLPRGGPGWCWCGSSTGRWLMAGWTLRMEDTNPSCHCIVPSVPCTATVASPHPGELAHKWHHASGDNSGSAWFSICQPCKPPRDRRCKLNPTLLPLPACVSWLLSFASIRLSGDRSAPKIREAQVSAQHP